MIPSSLLKTLYKKIHYHFSEDKHLAKSLANLLGFVPYNIDLYKQAFRHRSRGKELTKAHNERLEFLGDAILSGIIGHYLFERFPYRDEGFLTKMRSRLVSGEQLNHISRRMGLQQFIDKTSDVPLRDSSVSGDAFEALIGAIYLDQGYPTTRQFVLQRVLLPLVDIDQVEQTDNDFKSQFIEWAQREKASYEFKLIQELGTGNDRQFVIQLLVNGEAVGQGSSTSKKRAQQQAAKEAMAKLPASYEKGTN